MELFQKLQQRVKQDIYDFRRLDKEGRLDVLFNYGLDTNDIQFYIKLDDSSIEQITKYIQLENINEGYIQMLIDTHDKTMQAALAGASNETIEIIRSNCMSDYKS